MTAPTNNITTPSQTNDDVLKAIGACCQHLVKLSIPGCRVSNVLLSLFLHSPLPHEYESLLLFTSKCLMLVSRLLVRAVLSFKLSLCHVVIVSLTAVYAILARTVPILGEVDPAPLSAHHCCVICFSDLEASGCAHFTDNGFAALANVS